VPGVAGTWKDLTDSVKLDGRQLDGPGPNIAEVTTAARRATFAQITGRCAAEILELKNTINTMVDQLGRSRRK